MKKILCIICFFFVLPNKCMELPAPRLTAQEIIDLVSRSVGITIPILIDLINYQESLYTVITSFSQKKMSVTEYDARLRALMPYAIDLATLLQENGSAADAAVVCLIKPIMSYAHIMRNELAITPAKASEATRSFLSAYTAIKELCADVLPIMIDTYTNYTKNIDPGDPTDKKAETEYITKQEVGLNDQFSSEHFKHILGNIACIFEFEASTYQIIALRSPLLRNILSAIADYKKIVSMSVLFEKNMQSILKGKRDWFIKASSSIESAYFAYKISSLMSEDAPFEKIMEAVSPHLEDTNAEIKEVAHLGWTWAMIFWYTRKYNKLVDIFDDLEEKMPVVDAARQAYEDKEGYFKRAATLAPNAFLDFLTHTYAIPTDNATADGMIQGVESAAHILATYIDAHERKAQQSALTYKRLKLTLRKLSLPLSAEKKKYFANLSLDSYGMYSLKSNLSAADFTFLEELQKSIGQKKSLPTTYQEVCEQEQMAPKPVEPEQNKRKAKKKRNRRKKTGAPELPSEVVVANRVDALSLCPKAHVKTVYLLDQKIAKRFDNPDTDTIAYIYRLGDTDKVAPRVMNYHERVRLWQINPEQALAQKKFADNDPRKETSTLFHTFASEIDRYALKWGFKKKSLNKEGNETTQILLPGFIDAQKNRHEGFFTYAIDNKYLCYHRFFSECDWRNTLKKEWKVHIADE